ncbi:MAG: hypothetical protein WC707_00430 [Candidatus Babeliaceae bacterium]
MFKKILCVICLAIHMSFWSFLDAMIDNKYLDQYLLYRPFVIYNGGKHHFDIQPFVMTAHSASGDNKDESPELFEINGKYDQIKIDQALQSSGRTDTSLLRSDFRNSVNAIPWFMRGRFEAYGIGFRGEYMITDAWGIGGVLYAIHASSRMEMVQNKEALKGIVLGAGDAQELLVLNERMHQLLGVTPPLWSKTAFGDIDAYIVGKKIYDYAYKCKHIELAVKAGVLVPTAPSRSINNPASIPLGGNGHWGMYGMLDTYFLLKEDFSCGFLLQLSKRFAKTYCDRVPSGQEPTIYGAIVEQIRTDPGLTVGFAPYFTFERVRDGLGFGLGYTLVSHSGDQLPEVFKHSNNISVNTDIVERISSWKSEYVTLRAFYDCAFDCERAGASPVVSFMWDIPVNWLIAQRSYKTQGIAFIVESRF